MYIWLYIEQMYAGHIKEWRQTWAEHIEERNPRQKIYSLGTQISLAEPKPRKIYKWYRDSKFLIAIDV